MKLIINVDDENLEFTLAKINPVSLQEMLQRSRFDRSIFLSLVIEDPKLTAHEWHSQVPADIIDKIIDKIYEMRYDIYV